MPSKQQIQAAGAVLFRRIEDIVEVALIFRKGFWDLPKGKMEDDETPIICAKRELEEELGISDVEIGIELIQTYHEYEMHGTPFGKTTYWFTATAPEQEFRPQIEEDIEKVQWVEYSKASEILGYPNLVKVLDTFSRWLLRQKYAD